MIAAEIKEGYMNKREAGKAYKKSLLVVRALNAANGANELTGGLQVNSEARGLTRSYLRSTSQ